MASAMYVSAPSSRPCFAPTRRQVCRPSSVTLPHGCRDSESQRHMYGSESSSVDTRNHPTCSSEGRVRSAASQISMEKDVTCVCRLIGDFGYDPLNLGKNPAALKWYVQAEIIHGRLAMMGLAGMLIPSVQLYTSFTSVTSHLTLFLGFDKDRNLEHT